MVNNKKRRFVIVLAVMWLVPVSAAKTWHLEKGADWKAVSAESKDKYLLAVAQIKKLVSTGETEAVAEAIAGLKKDFPEIAGADMDAFVEAEMLFCEGKMVKAVRGYDKFLAEFPESELYEAALDRQFNIGTAFLVGQKIRVLGVFKMRGYAEGERIMDRISDRAGDLPIGIKAALSVARSLEGRGKFDEAYLKWSQIQSQWPTGQFGREALLGMARCKHAAYRGPKYDGSNLVSAKSYYESFKLRYPEDAQELGVGKILEQINEQLAYREFSIGQYYQRVGEMQSANLCYQMVIDNWPMSIAAKRVKENMNKNPHSEKAKK